MHPAPSIILFTSFAGLGFGLLSFLGLGLPTVTGWTAFVYFSIAYALSGLGLVASTFHLRRPERALKAFSQWRSSWLSREAWLSLGALVVMAAFGAGVVFMSRQWQFIGWAGSVLSLATVIATSMIYAQLKTVPRWNTWTTPLLFLLFSLSGGALISGNVPVAIALLIATAALQLFAWWVGDRQSASPKSTVETATGLGQIGKTRLFEPPHTGGNYLTHEMAFQVGRKHATKLRVIALFFGFAVPVALLLPPFSYWFLVTAAVSHLLGVLCARWLFFAEAQHVVRLYYGR